LGVCAEPGDVATIWVEAGTGVVSVWCHGGITGDA